jgi:hypothetical protein
VVQVTVTELLVRFVVATIEIAGGDEVTFVVRKVALAEVEDIPPRFAETASKSYVVPGVRPVSVTVWLVTIVGFSGEADPYPVVVPKFTSDDEAWSVVHVIVAVVLLIPPTSTFEIAGGPAGAVPAVLKVITAEFPVAPFAPVDCATK